jgi:hypothetical protein
MTIAPLHIETVLFGIMGWLKGTLNISSLGRLIFGIMEQSEWTLNNLIAVPAA